MNTFRLGALALSIILAGCATNGSTGSPSAGSGLGSVLGAAGTGGTGSSTDSKVGAAVDVFKAVTVSDDELKSVSQQFRAYEERTEKVAPAK
ncbi:peptidase M48, partial [Achromobacter xylosoxidans]|nr:peptidase M48 [Achromobacter xylosoxidans]